MDEVMRRQQTLYRGVQTPLKPAAVSGPQTTPSTGEASVAWSPTTESSPYAAGSMVRCFVSSAPHARWGAPDAYSTPTYNSARLYRAPAASPSTHGPHYKQQLPTRYPHTVVPQTRLDQPKQFAQHLTVVAQHAPSPLRTPSARRFHFDQNHPLSLFEAVSPVTGNVWHGKLLPHQTPRSPDSRWVNVSPTHTSALLYTAGVYHNNVLAAAAILGPEPQDHVAVLVRDEQSSPAATPAATPAPDGREGSEDEDAVPVGRASAPSSSTDDRGALLAVIAALQARPWHTEGFSRVVVATDSRYVVTGTCDWLDEWRRAGDYSQYGNADLWKSLDHEICQLTLQPNPVEVEVLHIPPEWNERARALALASAETKHCAFYA